MSYMYLAYLGMLLQICFIYLEQQKKYVPAVIQKGAASLVFVLIGFLGLSVATIPTFAKVVVAGLIFGLIGDVCLNLRFVLEKAGKKIFLGGILAFLIGHILYLVALIPLAAKVWVWLLSGVLVAAALLYWILTSVEAEKAFKIFGIVYIGAIMLLNCAAIGNLIVSPSAFTAVFAAGAVLFLLSDIVLILNTFGKETKQSLRVTNISLYYAGQILIALSLMFLK